MRKEQAPLDKEQALDEKQRRRREKKRARAVENTRRHKQNPPRKPVNTVMRLGRSIATGSTATIKYTRRAMGHFNDFTQSPETTKLHRLRGLKLTFPLFIAISFAILLVGIMVLDNSSVKVDTVKVSVVGLDSDLEGYTILHISDLHGRRFGDKQASLLRQVNSQSYNLAVFTGDMVGKSGDPTPFYELLEGMSANRKRYFIAGDSDPAPLLSAPREITGTLDQVVLSDWVLGAQQRGAAYLTSTTAVEVGSTRIWLSPASALTLNLTETVQSLEEQVEQETEGVLSGIGVDYQALPFTTWRLNQLVATQTASAGMEAGEMHIALSHMPPSEHYLSVAQELGAQQTRAYLLTPDLALAGHYCGGWRLPLYGAIYIPNTLAARHGWFPSQSEVSGLQQLGATMLYTSPGLGLTDDIYLPGRLFNSPKITLITLTAAIPSDMLAE